MTEEARRARADYIREWRKRNPDKQREYDARHWEKVAAKRKEQEQEVAKNNNGI